MKKLPLFLLGILIVVFTFSCHNNPKPEVTSETEDVANTLRGETFRAINPAEIPGNPIELIGDQWMLISAGNQEMYNTMTASWGTLGELWSRPVATCYVRPSRHTFGFMEENEYYTLCFFDEEYREVLNYCGTTSGRDHQDKNKAEVAGLTPQFTENGTVYFKEAYLVIECKKLYADLFKKEYFTTNDILTKESSLYPEEQDVHKFYIGEIVNCWMR
ncbi:flavin reductase [Bacteroidales bacterium OttesenSCG-928-B11]|nr:flavin reductase [Bacteroidales bacterium OttesenSCG-928-C03]MDL2311738.1 flavin reductase [Bacteroidales bacterium OttesenSCG-928-B11]MDL2325444.1 flavin reductase [Bacteroidales bacterium OttesenSCG-928-A14]